jgi:succinate dehydrogenase/fumarate reductase flavoprotein subunit
MEQHAPHLVDLVVVGSGAAGLTSALTALDCGLAVALVEADHWIGGATALSEGMIWVPNNAEARESPGAADPQDEAEAALAYLHASSGNFADQTRMRRYIDAAPDMLAFVRKAAGLRFALNRTSRDYYPARPGATLGHRAMNPLPANLSTMDRALFAQIRPPLRTMMLFGGLTIASQDVGDYMNAARSPKAFARVVGHILGYATDRAAGWPRGTRLANGNVIVAQLAEAVRKRGGAILTQWPVERLVTRNGRVAGVQGPGGTIGARLGVVLASGGFNSSHSERRVLAGPHPHIAIPAATTVHSFRDLVTEAGAALADDASQPVLWAPASVVPASVARSGPWPHFGDRAKPGVICLGPDGRRFANEAQVYHDFVPAMIAATGTHPEGAHCWIVTDHRALRRYGLGPIGPFPVRLGPYLRAGYLRRGRTVVDLAHAIGLPVGATEASLARFNGLARRGEDTDFGRGDSPYDRGSGDPEHGPNPTLGPLETGPFYAIRLIPGDIGVFIGVKVDAEARALGPTGAVVPGLWAVGSAAAPLTGGTYPAAGLTIGQAMTFGHVAALDARRQVPAARAAE